MLFKLFVFLLICYATADEVEKEGVVKNFRLFNWNWDSVHQVYVITTWIFVASLAKILFNLMKPLSKWLPDSSLLIIVGLALGYILRHTTLHGASLDSHVFFLYLLPPIIFDAGYFMPNRALFENFESVFVFSVIGTLWNTFAIGGSLLIMSQYNLFTMSFTTFEILVFSALISAVDPVAVIAVFEEIHVNEFLFINVFGEALFNDGVTVVLYQMFKSFALIGSEHLSPWDYATGGLSFFVVAIGGAAIGIIFAIVTSLVTKYTQEIRILAPVFIFLLPYMAYLTAEMVSLSSIIAIAVCGMLMKQYIKGNITEAATNSVKYFTKMLSQCSETVIFMFLGLSTISSEHHVDLIFISATLFFCLIYRAIGVMAQSYLLNKFRAKQFKFVDQFILSYGGLRGAIAYGLAVSIPASISAKPMFITTTIAVIYFTVFLQGITIKPLVNCLKIKRKEDRDATMVESVYNKYLDYMMSGVEDIAGQQGHYSFIENFERFNAKVIKPVLMRHETRQNFDATSIIRAYEKITLEDAIKLTKAKGALQNKRLEKVKSSSRVAREQQTVTPKDVQLARVMESGENIEQLYNLFSDLLDMKLGELKKQADKVDKSSEDDIQDDYMAQMGRFLRMSLYSYYFEFQGSHSTLHSMHHSAAHLATGTLFHRGPRRLSTGDLRGNIRDSKKQKHSMFELRHV
ncbi:unnamed protein product [Caenorhabditis brenneri]